MDVMYCAISTKVLHDRQIFKFYYNHFEKTPSEFEDKYKKHDCWPNSGSLAKIR